MILERISILNYKNIVEANLAFAPKVNCLIGNNGMGKTNILDAIYFLSFTKSAGNQSDNDVINHNAEFAMLQGHYSRRGMEEDITLSMQRGRRKQLRRGGKEYKRLSQHIGLLPLVMISPMDWDLIRGAGEERRRLMNHIIAQGDAEYLDALIRYNKALGQRNAMLREAMSDPILYGTVERQMTEAATCIHTARARWIGEFSPIFMRYYHAIAGDGEIVDISYKSHLNEASMQEILDSNRNRDHIMGYTTHGTHRDDIELLLGQHPMRKTGSQGQCKTYTIALRLAQHDFLKRATGITPILLLDDIFDKLDARRVESIIGVVSENLFGQIFITDTNRTHLDDIIARQRGDNAMFTVENGAVTPLGAGGPATS